MNAITKTFRLIRCMASGHHGVLAQEFEAHGVLFALKNKYKLLPTPGERNLCLLRDLCLVHQWLACLLTPCGNIFRQKTVPHCSPKFEKTWNSFWIGFGHNARNHGAVIFETACLRMDSSPFKRLAVQNTSARWQHLYISVGIAHGRCYRQIHRQEESYGPLCQSQKQKSVRYIWPKGFSFIHMLAWGAGLPVVTLHSYRQIAPISSTACAEDSCTTVSRW